MFTADPTPYRLPQIMAQVGEGRRGHSGPVEGRRQARWRQSVVGPRVCIPAVSREVVPPVVTVTGALPFPASPRQSVRKVLPYTAYRRPSPEGMHGAAVRDVPGETFQTDAVTGVDDELHPVTTTSSAVPFGEQHRHPLSDVAVELGEAARGVAVAVVLTPPAQKPVEFFNQQAGRQVAEPPAPCRTPASPM